MWRYSAENWRDQIIDFIERIAQGESVHLVGNSLGGYLAVLVASRRPDLVASLVLMNPTPFWGLLPPQQPFIWDGE
jgi:pimeloyl-ACP methyl ester carboxylesterase